MPFPLTETTVEQIVSIYGQFNDAELSAVVQASASALDEQDPSGHLLALKEQPLMQLLEKEGVGADTIAAYRSAVCLGSTMLRRYAKEKHIGLDDLYVNSERTYLFYPDLPTEEAHRRYLYWPAYATEDFTDPHYYSRYFQSEHSTDIVKGLQDKLVKNHIGFMEDDQTSHQKIFAYFCRGLLDRFELHEQLRWEQKVAAPNQVFDDDKHRPLTATTAWSQGEPDLVSRWRVGGLKTMRLTKEQNIVMEEQFGNTNVAELRGIMSVYRGIGGFVQETMDPRSPLLPVMFKQSEERYELSTEGLYHQRDRLVVRYSGPTALGHLSPPFVVPEGEADIEVVALCRNGQTKFLYDPDINLETEEEALAWALYAVDTRQNAA